MLGSLWPARAAALTAPIEAMRQNTQTQKPIWPRAIIGTIFLALAIGILVWACSKDAKSGSGLAIGACLFLLSMLILVTPLTAIIVRTFALLIWWLRPHARLAMRTLTANKRQSANTAAALMIGVALVAVGATLAASTKASTESTLNQQINTDLMISPSPKVVSIPDTVIDKVATVAGVKQVEPVTGMGLFRVITDAKTPEETITQVTYPHFNQYRKVPVVTGSVNKYFSQSLTAPQALVSNSWAKSHGLSVGDTFRISGFNASKTLTIAATIDAGFLFRDVLIERSLAKELGSQALDITTSCAINLKAGANQSEVQKEIEKAISDNPFMVVQNKEQAADKVATTINQVLTVLYALLALSLIIAALGIMNTLSLSVQQRFRELGLIRTVGLSSFGLSLMITVESVFITLAGTLLGITGGVSLAVFICKYLADSGITTIEIPWVSLGWICLLAVLVGTIAAAIPARRARKIPMLQAIATED